MRSEQGLRLDIGLDLSEAPDSLQQVGALAADDEGEVARLRRVDSKVQAEDDEQGAAIDRAPGVHLQPEQAQPQQQQSQHQQPSSSSTSSFSLISEVQALVTLKGVPEDLLMSQEAVRTEVLDVATREFERFATSRGGQGRSGLAVHASYNGEDKQGPRDFGHDIPEDSHFFVVLSSPKFDDMQAVRDDLQSQVQRIEQEIQTRLTSVHLLQPIELRDLIVEVAVLGAPGYYLRGPWVVTMDLKVAGLNMQEWNDCAHRVYASAIHDAVRGALSTLGVDSRRLDFTHLEEPDGWSSDLLYVSPTESEAHAISNTLQQQKHQVESEVESELVHGLVVCIGNYSQEEVEEIVVTAAAPKVEQSQDSETQAGHTPRGEELTR